MNLTVRECTNKCLNTRVFFFSVQLLNIISVVFTEFWLQNFLHPSKEENKYEAMLYVLNSALAVPCRRVGLTFFFFNKHEVCSAGGFYQAAAHGWHKMRSHVMFQQIEINPYLTTTWRSYILLKERRWRNSEWIRNVKSINLSFRDK